MKPQFSAWLSAPCGSHRMSSSISAWLVASMRRPALTPGPCVECIRMPYRQMKPASPTKNERWLFQKKTSLMLRVVAQPEPSGLLGVMPAPPPSSISHVSDVSCSRSSHCQPLTPPLMIRMIVPPLPTTHPSRYIAGSQ
tara:strand:+ start:5512 stop:5928 length:417 start_codon:yes stop_codon:yes gene_type:complete